ncbi:hypothetical protein JCM21900_004922 [Sporobolomyces salmonicolor]
MVSTLYSLDLRTLVWTKLWPKAEAERAGASGEEGPSPRYFHSAETWEDKLLLFGGQTFVVEAESGSKPEWEREHEPQGYLETLDEPSRRSRPHSLPRNNFTIPAYISLSDRMVGEPSFPPGSRFPIETSSSGQDSQSTGSPSSEKAATVAAPAGHLAAKVVKKGFFNSFMSGDLVVHNASAKAAPIAQGPPVRKVYPAPCPRYSGKGKKGDDAASQLSGTS